MMDKKVDVIKDADRFCTLKACCSFVKCKKFILIHCKGVWKHAPFECSKGGARA